MKGGTKAALGAQEATAIIGSKPHIAQDCGRASALAQALASIPGLPLPVMINVDVWPNLAALIQRCGSFAESAESRDALILTILTAADDTGTLEWQMAAAGAWAFTRHAALAWAPRGVRVNMIGLGASPPPDPDPVARGRGAPVHARPASVEDAVRTIHAMVAWPSMTGQFVRLGGL